ncbi:tetratricopeptide repeat protein [Streptomyces sp. NPDC046237]|uniref:tetratricopeptide repeat protein n=1 Tax=Streptomyces sp. NPDC046237 TaxID=3154914 RepID=UPI0033C8A669
MAIPKRPEPLEPWVESAAEAGDVAAMKLLGQYFYETGSQGSAPAERWLLAAAEAGDAEAMYSLTSVHHDRAVNATPHGKAHSLKAAFWCRRAAQAGWIPAIHSMHAYAADQDEREFWLRKAVASGDPWAPSNLAHVLDELGRVSDAEHWYSRATREPGGIGLSARESLGDFLLRQGRLEEAAECWRQLAEAGEPAGAWHRAYVLELLGRPEEAAASRQQGDALQAAERAREPDCPEW